MIERYTLPEMGDLWTETYKLKTWLQVEIAVCEAQAELGRIPHEAVETIKAKATFDPQRVLEIEAEVRHDMIAFLTNVNESVGDVGRYIHLGLTSSDVLDTALALQLVASLDVLLKWIECCTQAIRYQAQQHRNTVMIGRSHGVHAEPTTFGLKLALWYEEMKRNLERFKQAAEGVTRLGGNCPKSHRCTKDSEGPVQYSRCAINPQTTTPDHDGALSVDCLWGPNGVERANHCYRNILRSSGDFPCKWTSVSQHHQLIQLPVFMRREWRIGASGDGINF